MDNTLTGHTLSYAQLFESLKTGDYLHVPVDSYSKNAIQTECSRQNKYAGCNRFNNKYTTSTTLKKGYVTIFRRR